MTRQEKIQVTDPFTDGVVIASVWIVHEEHSPPFFEIEEVRSICDFDLTPYFNEEPLYTRLHEAVAEKVEY